MRLNCLHHAGASFIFTSTFAGTFAVCLFLSVLWVSDRQGPDAGTLFPRPRAYFIDLQCNIKLKPWNRQYRNGYRVNCAEAREDFVHSAATSPSVALQFSLEALRRKVKQKRLHNIEEKKKKNRGLPQKFTLIKRSPYLVLSRKMRPQISNVSKHQLRCFTRPAPSRWSHLETLTGASRPATCQ